MLAKGKDASDLFPAVVKNVVSKNIEVIKMLVYFKINNNICGNFIKGPYGRMNFTKYNISWILNDLTFKIYIIFIYNCAMAYYACRTFKNHF